MLNRILKNVLYGTQRRRNFKKSKHVTWQAYYDLKRRVKKLEKSDKYDFVCK
jgi:hypothetical protein